MFLLVIEALFVSIPLISRSQERYVLAEATNHFCRIVVAAYPMTEQAIKNTNLMLLGIPDHDFKSMVAKEPLVQCVGQGLQNFERQTMPTNADLTKFTSLPFTNACDLTIYRTNILLVTLSVSNFLTQTQKVIWHELDDYSGSGAIANSFFLTGMVLTETDLHLLRNYQGGGVFVYSFFQPHELGQKNRQRNIETILFVADTRSGIEEANFTYTNNVLMANVKIVGRQTGQFSWVFRSKQWI
jgi:hypothetical protein